MGIPSYFRRILQSYAGCLTGSPPQGAAALCFDFNCLIYRCLRAPDMPAYPDQDAREEEKDAWEAALFHEIKRAVKEIWTEAGRPAKVLLAVDGVVPMAKIRQQRARRFKSAWLRKSSCQFDTNAITPGTKFMDRLTTVLEELVKGHRGWELSSVQERGEGEHKVLHWLRAARQKGDIVVYGLDADLILLTMLLEEEIKVPLWLMREKEEFGTVSPSPSQKQKQEYQYLSLTEFKKRLGVEGYAETLNYIALMNLMGNDFLPHSITHKLNDDGHEYVLKEKRAGTIIVRGEVGKRPEIDWIALQEVCRRWAKDEEDKLIHMMQKKREQAKRGVLKGMEEREGLPLQWNIEKELLDQNGLMKNWRDSYWNWVQPSWTPPTREQVCQEYWKGFQWILDYYTGNPVDTNWYFSSWLPPLWSDLAECKREYVGLEQQSEPPTPSEQLAMVLPLESWGLVRNTEHRRLPILAPQYYPLAFSFQSAGRKWLWECEAQIPILSAARLREILQGEKQ